MQVFDYSDNLENIIRLSMIAKNYYELLQNNNNQLYKMSVKFVKEKKHLHMSNGVKEKCINLILETLNNVNDSDAFYQYLLVNVSCDDVLIDSLCTIFNDMLMHCENK